MAAFTSVQNGDWNDPQTWGNALGGEYPFKSSASDTATVLHTVTIASDNPYAGTGAVSVGSGGDMTISNHACAQQFCGAVAVSSGGKLSSADNANVKKLMLGGAVAVASGGEFCWQKSSELYFVSTSSNVYGVDLAIGGRFGMYGTSAAAPDSKITGDTTYGCYAYIYGGTWTTGLITISNATFDYVAKKGTSTTGVMLSSANACAEDECTIDGLVVTNPVSVCTYGISFLNCTMKGMKNVYSGSTAVAKYGIYCFNCVIKEDVSLNGKTSSAQGLRLVNCIVSGADASLNGEATSGRGISAEYCFINASAMTGIATSGYGIMYASCAVRGGTSSATATSGMGIHWGGSIVSGGDHASAADVSSGYGHLLSQNEIYGGTLRTAQAKYGIYWYYNMPSYLKGGRMICTGCANAVYPHTGLKFDVELTKSGAVELWLYGNTTDVSNNPTWIEPVIYRNHETNKAAAIYFECSPFNLTDFTTSGVTRNGTNLDIAAGGSIVSPEVNPWDVALWSAITYTTSGGSPTVYTRTSSDGGASWTAWTARASGADLSGVATGLNGADLIQWKLENASGTCTLQNLTITFSYNRETLPEFTEEWQGGVSVPTYGKSGLNFNLSRKMPSDSATVLVSLIKDDGTAEPLTAASASCVSGSLWSWSTANITTQPTERTHYTAVFTDQNANKVYFDVWLGGSEDLAIGSDKKLKMLI